MNLPFKMQQESPWEKYRAETFWTKEPETIRWIKSFNSHDIFFDVGANIGIYSLYAASLFPEMPIYAFEPMIKNYSALCANISMNDFLNIAVFPFAVGNKQYFGFFDSKKLLTGESGGQLSDYQADFDMIQIISIDKWQLHPDHIKIDIDGQELGVVKGMEKTLPHIKSILIEVSSKSKTEIVAMIEKAGFTLNNHFNKTFPHSNERRAKENIDAENIIFTRI